MIQQIIGGVNRAAAQIRLPNSGDHIAAFFREIPPLAVENFNKFLNLFGRDLCVCNTSFEPNWKKDNSGLYLFIHGVFGQPLIWNGHYSRLTQLQPNAEIRAPHVPMQANCSLEQAAEPFLKLIRDYVEKNPGKPICLFGFSRGGQIAAYVAEQFRDNRAVSIRVNTISGTHSGSQTMDTLDRMGIARHIFNNEFVQEMHTDAPISQRLIQQVATSPHAYHFYASMNDPAVSWQSAIPSANNGNYTVISGYAHNGSVEAVREHSLTQSIAWMESKKV